MGPASSKVGLVQRLLRGVALPLLLGVCVAGICITRLAHAAEAGQAWPVALYLVIMIAAIVGAIYSAVWDAGRQVPRSGPAPDDQPH